MNTGIIGKGTGITEKDTGIAEVKERNHIRDRTGMKTNLEITIWGAKDIKTRDTRSLAHWLPHPLPAAK
jgi:hypothetical protein